MRPRIARQHFAILGQRVCIYRGSGTVGDLIAGNLGAFASGETPNSPDLVYRISALGPYAVRRQGRATIAAAENRSALLYEVEKDIVLELQRRSAELFFFHSGAIAWQGRASLFVAESGSGKSTTTWALLHDGYDYLSDEIAPIALWTRSTSTRIRTRCV